MKKIWVSIVLIFCLNFTTNSKTKRTNGDINYRYQTGLEYSASLEKKLENLDKNKNIKGE